MGLTAPEPRVAKSGSTRSIPRTRPSISGSFKVAPQLGGDRPSRQASSAFNAPKRNLSARNLRENSALQPSITVLLLDDFFARAAPRILSPGTCCSDQTRASNIMHWGVDEEIQGTANCPAVRQEPRGTKHKHRKHGREFRGGRHEHLPLFLAASDPLQFGVQPGSGWRQALSHDQPRSILNRFWSTFSRICRRSNIFCFLVMRSCRTA